MSKGDPIFYLVNDGKIEKMSHDEKEILIAIERKPDFEKKKCFLKTVIPAVKKYVPSSARLKLNTTNAFTSKTDEIPVNPLPCPYCPETFLPEKIGQITCGKPPCVQQHRTLYMNNWRQAHPDYKRNWLQRQAKYGNDSNPIPWLHR